MAGTTTKSRRTQRKGSDVNDLLVQYNKLVDDAETLRSALSSGGVVAVTELMADHATFKVTVDQLETLAEELGADHATFKTAADEARTWATEVDADHDTINNILDFQSQDGVVGGSFTIAGTAATTLLGAGNVIYRIGGELCYAALDTTITLADSGDIVQNKYGAWRIVIDRAGVVTTQDTGAQMAFDNAEDALLCLSAVAPTANTATIGYFTVTDSGAGGFNIGTTNTTGGTATEVVYHVRGPRKQVAGLTAANGAATAVGTTPTQYATGTKDVKVNGVRLSQIAAEADKAFDDLDTVGQSQFGGWLIVTNLAQNATYALASNGIAGTVSAMTHASSAAAETQLDTIADQLPELFVPIAKLVLTNNLAGTWTAGTDDINGTDGTAAFTDATVGTWDRTASTGFDSHKILPPGRPASITAPIPAAAPATLSASTAITSGPATLSASVPSGTAVDAAGDLTAAKIGDTSGTAITV